MLKVIFSDSIEFEKKMKNENNVAYSESAGAFLMTEEVFNKLDFKYIPTDNLYINVESGQKLSTNKLYDVFLEIEGHTINIA